MNTTIIIPVYNEAESIGVVLDELLESIPVHGVEILCVDDGSNDDSRKVIGRFASRGVRLVRHRRNYGYGAAIKTGIRFANGTNVLSYDGDGQHVPASAYTLIARMHEIEYDMIVGSRGASNGGLTYRGVGKWLIRASARALLSTTIKDLNSGMKIYRRDLALRVIPHCPDGMSYSDIIAVMFIKSGCWVEEVGIQVRQRAAGRSTVSTKTAVETIYGIVHAALMYSPMRLFFPLSSVLFVTGLVVGMPIVLAGKGVSVGSALLVISAGLCFVIGMLADQIAAVRKSIVGVEAERISVDKGVS